MLNITQIDIFAQKGKVSYIQYIELKHMFGLLLF